MRSIYAIFLIFTVSACTVNKTPVATGGSKSDGIVTMSYSANTLHSPKVNWLKAAGEAAERCKAWGYKSAEPFGGASRECVRYHPSGRCRTEKVSISYQCGDF